MKYRDLEYARWGGQRDVREETFNKGDSQGEAREQRLTRGRGGGRMAWTGLNF